MSNVVCVCENACDSGVYWYLDTCFKLEKRPTNEFCKATSFGIIEKRKWTYKVVGAHEKAVSQTV